MFIDCMKIVFKLWEESNESRVETLGYFVSVAPENASLTTNLSNVLIFKVRPTTLMINSIFPDYDLVVQVN